MSQLLKVKEAAEVLSVSPTTLYRYCELGKIPHIKKDFGIRFQMEDLLNWLNGDKRNVFPVDSILKNALTNSPPIDIDNPKGGELAMAKTKTRLNYGYGAVYIRKKKSGKPRFYADYRNRTGNRIQKLIKNAATWQEAQEWLKRAVLREHYSECGIQEKRKPITLKEFIDMFIENYSKPNKKSWKDDYYRLRKVVQFFGGNTHLHKLTPLDIEKFKATKFQEDSDPQTINTYLRVLKRMYNIAITWGYTQSNPVREVRMYSEAEARRERVLTRDEEVRLLEAVSERLRTILVVALNAGMRRGEILRLEWRDINFEERTILVRKSKSGKPRTVTINSVLLDEIFRLKSRSGDSQYLFPNLRTGEPLKTVRKPFEDTCKKAGIQNLRFHDLRRTFGSRLALAGIDLNRIKELLGHASVKTTEIYLHADRRDLREAVEALCIKPLEPLQKPEDLLHIRDKKEDRFSPHLTSRFFSMN